jgi:hypothetical protein
MAAFQLVNLERQTFQGRTMAVIGLGCAAKQDKSMMG